jgi:hypothetical protein
LSLIDSDGVPTEVAKKWRIDETYEEACEAMLRSGFPADITQAVPNGAESEVIVNLFMTRGLGEGSAKNLARIYRLIASRVPPETKKARAGSQEGNGGKPRQKGNTETPKDPSEREGSATAPSDSPRDSPPTESGIAVLRYFLDRGRLAEIRIPRDMEDREKRKLFAHLKIDLLDEVTE